MRSTPSLMVATFNLRFITSKSGQILGLLSQGAFDLDVLGLAVMTLPFMLGALWIGIRVRRKVDMETCRGMLRASLWVISTGVLRPVFMA